MPEILDGKQVWGMLAQPPWQPRQPIQRRRPSGNRTSASRTAHSSDADAGPWRRTAGRLAAQTAGWPRRRPTVELRSVAPARRFVHTHPSSHTTAALRRPVRVGAAPCSMSAHQWHSALYCLSGSPRARRNPGWGVTPTRPVFAVHAGSEPTCAQRRGQSRPWTPLCGVLRAGGRLGLSNGFARATRRCRAEQAYGPRSWTREGLCWR